MEGGTSGYPVEPLPEHVYWRRRFAVVAVVLGVLGLIIWSCGASRRDGGQQQVGAQGTAPAVSPASSPGTTVTVTDQPQVSASPSLSGSASPSPFPSGSLSASPSASASSGGDDSARRRGECRARDVRLAVEANREAYGAGQRPRFRVRVTSARRCAVELGRKDLKLTVTSGSDRIWSSADCASADDDVRRKVSPHTPYETVVTWPRVRSHPDRCGDRAPQQARPGWYVVTAKLGRLASDQVVFQIVS